MAGRLSLLRALLLLSISLLTIMTGCTGLRSNSEAAANAMAQADFVFLLNQGGMVAGFNVDRQGNLAAIPGSPWQVPDSPNNMIRSGNLLLFTTTGGASQDPSRQNVLTYRIDQTTGAISPAGSAPLGRFAFWETVNSSGNLLYVNAPSSGNQIFLFTLGQDGTVAPAAGSPLPPDSCNGWLTPGVFDATHSIVFKSLSTGGCGFHPQTADFVQSVRLNSDGTLGSTLNQMSTLEGGLDTLEAVKLTPDESLLVTLQNMGMTPASPVIVTMHVDVATGSLSPAAQSPTTGDPTLCCLVGQLQMDPSGHFLLLGDMRAGSLGMYAVHSDGSVSPVPGAPYAMSRNWWAPYAFSTSGRWVLATDASGHLLSFSVDSNTRALTPAGSAALPPSTAPYPWGLMAASGR